MKCRFSATTRHRDPGADFFSFMNFDKSSCGLCRKLRPLPLFVGRATSEAGFFALYHSTASNMIVCAVETFSIPLLTSALESFSPLCTCSLQQDFPPAETVCCIKPAKLRFVPPFRFFT